MYVCYLDESGVPENSCTSHLVLVGLAIPGSDWKAFEAQIRLRKAHFGLGDAEIHTAWMARRYVEQERVAGFESLSQHDRRAAVAPLRQQHLLRLAAAGTRKQLEAAKKNYRKTEPYIHLTRSERINCLAELGDTVGGWQEARLFAEAIDKREVYGRQHVHPPFDFAFTELIQRFEYFLRNRGNFLQQKLLGLIVQDNNQTVAKRLTDMMLRFHQQGTRWTNIDHIVETPLFVDSQLTSMVQMADLCGYAIRRYFENDEADLFDRIYSRFDRTARGVVGIRHFAGAGCICRVCADRS